MTQMSVPFSGSKKAYLFPGQGFQYVGMGKKLYEVSPIARHYFEVANKLLGYRITDIMFDGPEEVLFDTTITQNAIYILSLLIAWREGEEFRPAMVSGHSLGETTALVANGMLSFEDGLMLMDERSCEMEKAFKAANAKMTAIIGLPDDVVEDVVNNTHPMVVAANYNCPGQIVIAGTEEGVEKAKIKLARAGARRFVDLHVGGAVHSPLMQPVVDYLEKKLRTMRFNPPSCPVYPNVTGVATVNLDEIRECLTLQQIRPLRWTTTIQNMRLDGATHFIDCGPPHVISGMVRRINKQIEITSAVAFH
jgi:[acyl-carrier-protein] S-malonyltransferase